MKLHGAVGGVLFCLVTAALGAAGCSSSSGGGGPDLNGCNADSTVDCSGGGDGYSCDSGDNPEAEDSSLSCSTPTTDPSTGNDLFCCFTWTGGTSTCTPDDDLTSQCPDADSYGYQCDDPTDDPTSLDSSLVCSSGVADGSETDFCCTYGSGGGSSGSSSGSSSGGTTGCDADPSLSCDAGATGVSCPSGDTPDASTFGICSDPSPQSDGSDGFCCVDQTFSDCTEDDSVTASCDYPSFGFSCTAGSPDPSADDPSLTCSTPTTDPNTGDDLYCCQ